MDSSHSENISIQGDTSLSEVITPDVSTEKKKIKNKNKGRNVSGYIVFAAEYRKEIAAANPDMSFGEISKLVGSRWKALDPELKVRFEDKAKVMAQEQAAKQAEADRAFGDSLNFYPVSQSPGGEHGTSPGPSKGSYTPSSVHGISLGLLPQSTNQHSLMQNGLAYHSSPNSVQTAGSGHQMAPPPPPRPPSPMFVSVPPKTQRLVHSEAYLRYIENLNPDSHTVGNWDRSLYATQENTPLPNNCKLPVHWLANGVGHHENAANALWALRDLMMKDAVTISRTLEFSQL
ncbi:hypothetical protein LSH36_18g10050 [Paralvinella palmiformis]|uniref:HMG box domain-containing protein n=1 Tax=Paralvinella palmiformis TaxID=53620 RepID=A0AAD9NIF3_9ANNE|nr:hypothetical protein LSH36_18g10050 [Paralvinella palmiformis]